ncbi:MAG: hypothetical protein L0271_16510 [Gemmatimonadetes bacterium]|nr:hypothetical protein [Gemmatimonadota bacterium]
MASRCARVRITDHFHHEVARILAAVRIPVYRVCLSTSYTCGLRRLEGAQRQVPSIDATAS